MIEKIYKNNKQTPRMAKVLKSIPATNFTHIEKNRINSARDNLEKLFSSFKEIYDTRKKLDNLDEMMGNYLLRICFKNTIKREENIIELNYHREFCINWDNIKNSRLLDYRESDNLFMDYYDIIDIATIPFYIVIDIFRNNICKLVILDNESVVIRRIKYFQDINYLKNEVMKYFDKYNFNYEFIYFNMAETKNIADILNNVEKISGKRIYNSGLKLKNFKHKCCRFGIKFNNFKVPKDENFFSFNNFIRFYLLAKKFGLITPYRYRKYLLQYFLSYYKNYQNSDYENVEIMDFVIDFFGWSKFKASNINLNFEKFKSAIMKLANNGNFSDEYIKLCIKIAHKITCKEITLVWRYLYIYGMGLFNGLGKLERIIYDIDHNLNKKCIDYDDIKYLHNNALLQIRNTKIKIYDKFSRLHFNRRIINFGIFDKIIGGIKVAASGLFDMESKSLQYINIEKNEENIRQRIKINRDNTYSISDNKRKIENDLVGYKVAKFEDGSDCLVKLIIPTDAKVATNGEDIKLRCDKAYVSEIYEISIRESNGEAIIRRSNSDKAFPYYMASDFIYEKGKLLTISDFNGDLEKVCVPGIHFFLTKEEVFQFLGYHDMKVSYDDIKDDKKVKVI